MDNLWQRCLDQLSQKLTADQFSIWIKPLRLMSLDEDSHTLRLIAENPMKKRTASELYLKDIQEVARHVFDQDELKVEFVLPNAQPKRPIGQHVARPVQTPNGPAQPTVTVDQPSASAQSSATAASAPATKPSPRKTSAPVKTAAAAHARTGLNPDLTFETLVPGQGNQLVLAAAHTIANNPLRSGAAPEYNPLYIYGSTGLGKTHVMHAIGNQVHRDDPELKIRYIDADTFWRDMGQAYRHQTIDAWMDDFSSIDLLLIDDIQFFSKKDRTQENFFHLFEKLVSRKRQVIISSDTYPRDLKQIEQRLITRFSMGLSVPIDPPELEMRVDIVKSKAKLKPEVCLTEDAAWFIANSVRSNVRELEGALTKVIAYAKFQNQTEITPSLCREALKDLINSSATTRTVPSIISTVAEYYRVKVSEMESARRHASIVRPRQVAMYLAKELTSKSYPAIAEHFGNRNHTTVMHACKKIAELRQTDSELNHQIHLLEQTIQG